MKKTTFQISYDEERLNALLLYMQQKGGSLEDELIKTIDTLFNRNVPQSVKEYLTLKGTEPSAPPAKSKSE